MMERKNILAQLSDFMKSKNSPSWLVKETIHILERTSEQMGEDDLYDYLLRLGKSTDFELPEAFMNRDWLISIYRHHESWVEKEVASYLELSYESLETVIGNSPLPIRSYSETTQKTYIAICTHLLNVFAQIDEMKTTEKTDSGDAMPSRSFLSYIQSFFGYLFIVFAYVMIIGLFFLILNEGFLAYFFTYILIGALPFILGIVMTKKATFHNFYKQRLSHIYFYLSFIVPLLFTFFHRMMEWKKILQETDATIYLASNSSSLLGFIHYLLIVIIIILLGIIIINEGKKKKLVITLTIFIVVFFAYQAITLNDYREISNDQIVYSSIGDKQTYAWDEIEQVDLIGKISRKNKSNGVGEAEFVWSFSFEIENGETITFGTYHYNEDSLKKSLKIKEKIASEQIPVHIPDLSQEDQSTLQIEMDAKDEKFVPFFQELFETE